jgi:hypothetical protein
MTIGLVVAVIGAATMNPYICAAAGFLLVGGIVGACVFGKKMSDAASDVSSTKSQIATTQKAIEELTAVVANYQSLSDLYGVLNTFFGRMTLDSDVLVTLDDATAAQLGEDVLADPSSINAASDMTDAITTACTTYLDVLSKQGIVLPTTSATAIMRMTATAHSKTTSGSEILFSKALSLDADFHHTVTKATDALNNGNTEQYHKLLATASVIQQSSISTQHFSDVSSGLWYDVPALTSTGAIWAGFKKGVSIQGKAALSLSSGTIDSADSVEGSLNSVRPEVITLLSQTVQLANTTKTWADKYPNMPTPSQMGDAQHYQDEAIAACQSAQNAAAKGNNAFVDFNHKAQTYQQGLEAQINDCNNKITGARASADNDRHNLSPPWYVYIGGVIAVTAWTATEMKNISDRLDNTVNDLNGTIAGLKNHESSGITFAGQTMTWQTMVEKVSHDLFFIYNILTGVEGQLMENPSLYAQFMKVEWQQLANNANDVLTILGAHSPVTTLSLRKKVVSRSLRAANKNATNGGNKQKVVDAVSADNKLGDKLMEQSKSCEETFRNINIVLALPYITDIIGYWDEAKTEKKTLFDVTTELKGEVGPITILDRIRNRPLTQSLVCRNDFYAVRNSKSTLFLGYSPRLPSSKCTERQAHLGSLHQRNPYFTERSTQGSQDYIKAVPGQLR